MTDGTRRAALLALLLFVLPALPVVAEEEPAEPPLVEIALDELPRLDFGPQAVALTDAYQLDRYGIALLLPPDWEIAEDEGGVYLNAPGYDDGAGLQFYEAYDVAVEEFHAYMTDAILEDPEIGINGWYGGIVDGQLMPFLDLTITLAAGTGPEDAPIVARQLVGLIALPDAQPVIVISGARMERWPEYQTLFLAILGSVVAQPSAESQAFEELEGGAGTGQ